MERLPGEGGEGIASQGDTPPAGPAILGVYRRVGEVGQLISLLRYSGFDLRNLSLLFLDGRGGASGATADGLKAGLLVDGARALGGDDSDVFAAGPLAGRDRRDRAPLPPNPPTTRRHL